MGLASFIEDIQAEMERIQKEKEEEEVDPVMNQMFGGAAENGQRDVLEEPGDGTEEA